MKPELQHVAHFINSVGLLWDAGGQVLGSFSETSFLSVMPGGSPLD